MPKHELSTNYTGETKLLSSPVTKEAVIRILADNPDREYNAWGIAEKLGSDRIHHIRVALNRMAGFGKGQGPVKRTTRGFYQYCQDKKEPLLDQIRRSGRFGIENLAFTKTSARHVILGDTPPQLSTTPKGELSSTKHLEKELELIKHQISTEKAGGEWVHRLGYPRQLRTGQEVLWMIHPERGEEWIIFKANGSGPFSLDLVEYLIEEMKGQGLGEEWMRTSMELNVDTNRITLAEPVTFQAHENQILKFYQHGGVARLEVADRRKVPYDEAFRLLLDLNDRAHGRQALKRVGELEGVIEELQGGQRRLENLHRNLSDKFHKGQTKQKKITEAK